MVGESWNSETIKRQASLKPTLMFKQIQIQKNYVTLIVLVPGISTFDSPYNHFVIVAWLGWLSAETGMCEPMLEL